MGCAAERRSSVRAVVLFPAGRVSPFQERQLTCWGDNVLAIEVDGDFDECQRLVKAAFADASLSAEHSLTSANSINIGRLLPQVAYAAQAALRGFSLDAGRRPASSFPLAISATALQCCLARAIGLPVGPVVLATNANRTLKDWHSTGHYDPALPSRRWPMRWTSATRAISSGSQRFRPRARTARGAGHRRADRGADSQRSPRIRLVSAFGDRGRGLNSLIRLRALGAAWIVAATAHPVQVRRDGRAADRPQDRADPGARGDPRPAAAQDQDRREPRRAWRSTAQARDRRLVRERHRAVRG